MSATETENQALEETAPQEASRASRKGKTPKVKPPKTKGTPTPPAAKETPWPSNVQPSLIFLPAKIRSAETFKKSVRQAIILSAVMIVGAGVAYGGVVANTAKAEQKLESEQARGVTLASEIAMNKPVQDYWEGLVQRKISVSGALEDDLAYAKIVEAVQSANTVGATFTSINTKEAGDAGCPTSNPFEASTAIGCIMVTGTVADVSAVGVLLNQLDGAGGIMTDPYASSSTVVEDKVNFAFTVGYTQAAMSFKSIPFEPTPEEVASLPTVDPSTVAPTDETVPADDAAVTEEGE